MSYPECQKLKESGSEPTTIRDFIEWAMKKDIGLCKFHPDFQHSNYQPITQSFEDLLMEFLEIDPKKLEEERQTMIADLQKGQ